MSVAVGESCFTFEIASCQDGCNFNEAEQVCRGKGGKLAEPESKEIAAKILGGHSVSKKSQVYFRGGGNPFQ